MSNYVSILLIFAPCGSQMFSHMDAIEPAVKLGQLPVGRRLIALLFCDPLKIIPHVYVLRVTAEVLNKAALF
jgi:hypothetical protein